MDIGFVGLGAMGSGIVPRLMAAGHAVTGWNRSKDKAEPLIKSGMRFAATPRAAAAVSEIVFSIVTDAAAVRAVALGDDGIIAGLKPGSIYVDMSTIAPDASRAVSAAVRRARARDARRADLRQPGDAGAGQCLADGRRRPGGVRAGRAGAARDRPEGDLYRRAAGSRCR